MTTTDWVVVLEVVRCPSTSPIDAESLRRLLQLLCDAEPEAAQPVALLAHDRYALHLSVRAEDIPEAIVVATFRWRNMSTALGLEGWEARRAEVMTKAEFDQEAHGLMSH